MIPENIFFEVKFWHELDEAAKDQIRKIRGSENNLPGQHVRHEMVRCKICNYRIVRKKWEAIDISCNQSMLPKIKSGELKIFYCPSCEKHYFDNSDFLCYDSERKFAVEYCASPERIMSANEIAMSELTQKYVRNLISDSYTYRITGSYASFVDRLTVLLQGRDDRIVEIMKWGQVGLFYEEHPESMDGHFDIRCYFEENDGKNEISYYINDEHFTTIPFSEEMYQYLLKSCKGKLPKRSDDLPLILYGDLCDRLQGDGG